MSANTKPTPTRVRTTATKPAVRPKGFVSAQTLFQNYMIDDKGGYISQEFQDFGYRLAIELDDLKHKSLYMKLAKSEPRAMLERALSFVSDAPAVKSKAKLFMWKYHQLKEEKLKSP